MWVVASTEYMINIRISYIMNYMCEHIYIYIYWEYIYIYTLSILGYLGILIIYAQPV